MNFRFVPPSAHGKGQTQDRGPGKDDDSSEAAQALNLIQVAGQLVPGARPAVGSDESIVEITGPKEPLVRVWPTLDSTAMTSAVFRTTIPAAALVADYRMIWDSSHLAGLSRNNCRL